MSAAMWGLSESHYNIVKRRCRECISEIRNQIAGGEKYDHIAAMTISKHHESIKVLVTRLQFVWLCGKLEERWGKDFDRE